MNNKVGVLVLHGIGSHKQGYSCALVKKVAALLKSKGCDSKQVEIQEVVYTDIFDKQQREHSEYLLNTSGSCQFISRLIRRLLAFVLSDAVSYRASRKDVHIVISEHIGKLYKNLPESAPVIVVAHSMGVMAISDYIYDLQKKECKNPDLRSINNLKSIISFGCNIPLFEMGHDETVSIKRPSSDEDKTFRWINFFSPFDVLGYRIKKYYTQKPDFEIDDKKIYAGGVFTKWNIFCHVGYWKNNEIHKAIVDSITKHLKNT